MSDPDVEQGPWSVILTSGARRDLNRLPANVAWAASAFLAERLAVAPVRMGNKLEPPYERFRVARLGAYRVVYRVEADAARVIVHAVRRRADVYGIR